MKRFVCGVLLCIPFLLGAQEPDSHQKRFYQDETGKLFWNRYLPFYLNISSSPEEKGVQLQSENQAEYANPAYFDTEGINHIRTRSAVDGKTMQAVVPQMEITWEVYADGRPPYTTASFDSAQKFTTDSATYYGKGLQVSLESGDQTSGVLNTYFTELETGFNPYANPIPFYDEGARHLSYYAADNVGNVEEVHEEDFIVDTTAPTSNVVITGPNKENILNTTSRIDLSYSDNLSGTAQTFYRINDGEMIPYDGGHINKNQLPDGEHTLYFYSVDNVGNAEEIQKHVFYLDKISPIIAADAMGDRYLADGKVYFSGRTKLKLTTVDNKSGVKDVQYTVNDEEFRTYNEPFYLPTRAGYHVIRYFATDNMDNKTMDNAEHREYDKYEHNVKKVYVDLTGPTIDFRIDGPTFTKRDTQYVSPKTKIFIAGKDTESGLKYLSYSVDGVLQETEYESPFSVTEDGFHTIEYFGYDNVNNRNKKESEFIVDANPPEIFSNFSVPSFDKAQDGYPVFPSYVKLYIGATDRITGNEKLLVSINGSTQKEYTGKVDGFKTGEINQVNITAVDKVGNERTHIVKFYIED